MSIYDGVTITPRREGEGFIVENHPDRKVIFVCESETP